MIRGYGLHCIHCTLALGDHRNFVGAFSLFLLGFRNLNSVLKYSYNVAFNSTGITKPSNRDNNHRRLNVIDGLSSTKARLSPGLLKVQTLTLASFMGLCNFYGGTSSFEEGFSQTFKPYTRSYLGKYPYLNPSSLSCYNCGAAALARLIFAANDVSSCLQLDLVRPALLASIRTVAISPKHLLSDLEHHIGPLKDGFITVFTAAASCVRQVSVASLWIGLRTSSRRISFSVGLHIGPLKRSYLTVFTAAASGAQRVSFASVRTRFLDLIRNTPTSSKYLSFDVELLQGPLKDGLIAVFAAVANGVQWAPLTSIPIALLAGACAALYSSVSPDIFAGPLKYAFIAVFTAMATSLIWVIVLYMNFYHKPSHSARNDENTQPLAPPAPLRPAVIDAPAHAPSTAPVTSSRSGRTTSSRSRQIAEMQIRLERAGRREVELNTELDSLIVKLNDLEAHYASLDEYCASLEEENDSLTSEVAPPNCELIVVFQI
ncbi:hypothetical protein DXG01_001250 [Tephrocybe rancida]|nr:hypothetical protein DXG01_001250 [Tephrocybe rancida]